jgi:hydrogenase expression/formation protein HypC
MCLAIPSKVIEIKDENTVIVDTMGSKRLVSTMLLEDPAVIGDYLLIHVGYAMQKIDEKEAAESLNLFREIESKTQDSKEI